MTDKQRTALEYNGEPCWQYPDGSIRSRVTGHFRKAGEGNRFKAGDRRTRAAGKAGAEAMLRRRPAVPRGTGAPGATVRPLGPPSSKRTAGRGPGVQAPSPGDLRPLLDACPAGVRARLEELARGDLGAEAPGPPQAPGVQGAEGGHGAAGPDIDSGGAG